jgi:hypothetical protein
MPQADTAPSSPSPDQLAWVREAIDGLRHSQNIAVGVLGGSVALLAAVFGGFMIWQAGDIKDLGGKIDKAQETIVARVDSLETKLDGKITDTRERVIKLETQLQGVSEQLARFQRGALDFELLPKPVITETPLPPNKPPASDQTDLPIPSSFEMVNNAQKYCKSLPSPKLLAMSRLGRLDDPLSAELSAELPAHDWDADIPSCMKAVLDLVSQGILRIDR